MKTSNYFVADEDIPPDILAARQRYVLSLQSLKQTKEINYDSR